jgi:hypothetical protein
MEKDLKICVNCGTINRPDLLKCQECGIDLLTEPADPMQSILSETNVIKSLIKGDGANLFVIITSLVIGLFAILFGMMMFSMIFDPSQEDKTLVGTISITVIVFGLLICANSIRLLIIKNKNKL